MLYLIMVIRKIIIQICVKKKHFWIKIDNANYEKTMFRSKINIIFTENN